MTVIDSISLRNGVTRNNIERLLGYAVRKRKGYYKDIRMVDERRGETLDKFKSVGLIKTGHTLKNETYSITELGDLYYQDVFGTYNYLKNRLLGLWDRVKADLADRLKD